MATETQARTAGVERSNVGAGASSNMIQSVEIRNFRCFREAKIEGLRRINVIVGGSGSGKTAFLEALFMCAGMQTDFFLKAQSWRGLEAVPSIQLGANDRSFRDIWQEMFFGFDDSRSIVLALSLTEGKQRRLAIHYDSSEEGRNVILTPTGSKAASIVTPLLFEGVSETGKPFNGPVAVTPQGTIPLPQFSEPYPMAFLPPSALLNSQGIARLFSELSKRQQHGPVVEAVSKLFPMVHGLSVEVEGGSKAVFASVRGLPEKLYIGSLSAGINKYLAALLVVATQSGGAVAVDEIENGLYYRNLEAIWNSIVEFSGLKNTQLFVTTHSLECLRAMLPAIADSPDDFCLLRSERQDGESSMKVFDGEHFEAALEQNFEIR